MNFFQALILGILEGATEFLPISSTGHLIIAEQLLEISQTPFVKTFTIAIQLGAICAVVVVYGKKLYNDHDLLKKILIGFIPTGIIGFLLYKIIKQYFLGNSLVVAWALIVGGIFLVFFDYLFTKIKHKGVSERTAFFVGCFQSLAVVPGVSRSASAIIGGLLLGVEKQKIVEFSFLLAIPTVLAATSYDIFKTRIDLVSSDLLPLATGFIASFFVGLIAIKFLLRVVVRYGFMPFGIYRILLGSSILIFLH